MKLPLDGGCLRGAVRYRISAEPRSANYCHCWMCRRAAGAPVVARLTVRNAAFAWTAGAPTVYRSSAEAERLHCRTCGTQLACAMSPTTWTSRSRAWTIPRRCARAIIAGPQAALPGSTPRTTCRATGTTAGRASAEPGSLGETLMKLPLEGGCLCGAVRYRISAEPRHADYCHCRMCQRATGAPVVPWLTMASAGFAWTRGEPAVYRSSPEAERLFCPTCGTQMAFRVIAEPDLLDVTLASLDDPEAVRPSHHIWTASRIAWFDTRDDLPRHPGRGPEPAG